MTLVILYNKKSYREGFETLDPTMTVGELKALIRDKLKLANADAKFFTNAGKMLKPEMDDWSFRKAGIKNGNKIQVTCGSATTTTPTPHVTTPNPSVTPVASTTTPVNNPAPATVSVFPSIEEQLAVAQGKFDALIPMIEEALSLKDIARYADLKKQLLFFNSVIQLMTRIDAAKITHAEEYEANGKGRALLKVCNTLLDKVESYRRKLQE